MKKHLLLVLLALLFPVIANAITPTPGRYEGTAVDFNRVHHYSFRFHLAANGDITDFHINGLHLNVNPQGTAGEQGVGGLDKHHHEFHFDTNNHGSHYRYTGHGKWEGNHVCRGDFRLYAIPFPDTNTYFTFESHWKHG